MKSVNKKLRLEYKIAIGSFTASIVMGVINIFAILQVYSLVGDGIDTGGSSADSKLETYEIFATVNMIVLGILIFVMFFSVCLGVYKDVQTKPKN
jgi:hypothetical protein